MTFLTHYSLKLTIVSVKIYYFPYRLRQQKQVKASLRNFIFLHPRHWWVKPRNESFGCNSPLTCARTNTHTRPNSPVSASVVLSKYWETPVVKACSRELSCVLIVGTFLSFCTTFIIVAKPTNFTCGVMRFMIGFCYTICYAAVVTKTNRGVAKLKVYCGLDFCKRTKRKLKSRVVTCYKTKTRLTHVAKQEESAAAAIFPNFLQL